MNEKLKPCPFCGGNAMFLTITNKSSHSAVVVMFKIKCMKCGTELPKSYECEIYMDQNGGIRTGKDEQLQIGTGGRTMRLIDADNLVFNGRQYNSSQMKAILDFVDVQPTAYDPDKVVEQLEELRKECEDPLQEYDPNYFIDKAIEIVKGGGVE